MGFLKTLFTGKRDELTEEEMKQYEEFHKTDNESYQLSDESEIISSNLELDEVLRYVLTLSSSELVKLKNQIAQREDDISRGVSSSMSSTHNQVVSENLNDNSTQEEDVYVDNSLDEKDNISTNTYQEDEDLIEFTDEDELSNLNDEENTQKNEREDAQEVEEFVEIDEISVSKASSQNQDEEDETSKDDPTLFSIIHDELMELFEEGQIILLKEEFSFPSLGSRETLAFGIFNSDYSKISDQTHWFIQNLKRFSRLKECKMLLSEENEKDLILEVNDKYAVLISFKTSNLVKDNFEFNRKWD